MRKFEDITLTADSGLATSTLSDPRTPSAP